jgi:hypothetical protein
MNLNHWTRAGSKTKWSPAALVPVVLTVAIACGATSVSAAPGTKNIGKPDATSVKAAETTRATRNTATKANATKARAKKVGAFNPDDESVELFEAIENGDIKVRVIPKDSTQARVFIQNKTKKPLNVKLPEAFAAVPVLAQMGGGGQGMGGGGGMAGGGGGGGFFNVPAEKEGNFKVACMCLEHGKPEPRAAMAYMLVPIEKFTEKPGVKELCTMLGDGKIPQRAAQVAAWHLNNDMSWEELAAKKISYPNGDSEPYFTAEELHDAVSIVSSAMSQVEEKPAVERTPSPGETARGE